MAVFKWNANTPAKFNDGEEDFQHIGLVTSVKPLRIVHASSSAGCVTVDTKMGKWSHWGWLKDVENDVHMVGEDASYVDIPSKVVIVCDHGRVNIRRGNGKQYSSISLVEPCISLEYVATADNGWAAVRQDRQAGRVMVGYCKPVIK